MIPTLKQAHCHLMRKTQDLEMIVLITIDESYPSTQKKVPIRWKNMRISFFKRNSMRDDENSNWKSKAFDLSKKRIKELGVCDSRKLKEKNEGWSKMRLWIKFLYGMQNFEWGLFKYPKKYMKISMGITVEEDWRRKLADQILHWNMIDNDFSQIRKKYHWFSLAYRPWSMISYSLSLHLLLLQFFMFSLFLVLFRPLAYFYKKKFYIEEKTMNRKTLKLFKKKQSDISPSQTLR